MRVKVLALILVLLSAAAWWLHLSGREPEADDAAALPEPSLSPPRVEGPLPRAPEVASEPAFVGPEGDDEHGHPLRVPDRAALLGLLRAGRFADLDRNVRWFQTEFEADPRKELWPSVAAAAFAIDDPEVGKAIDAWARAFPDSFAPLLARAEHRTAVAWHYRGHDWAKDTRPEQFDAMSNALQPTLRDLARALELAPRLVAAHTLRLSILKMAAEPDPADLAAALEVCPTCVWARAEWIVGLEPRWGGSYAAMEAFAEKSIREAPSAPKLALLRGYPGADRCSDLLRDERFEAALDECRAALTHGERGVLRELEARALIGLGREQEALTALEAGLRRLPQYTRMLVARARILGPADRALEAAADLLTARRVDPTDAYVAENAEWIAKRLEYLGHHATKSGDRERAARLHEAWLALRPDDTHALVQRGIAESGEVESLRKAVAAAPDDFEAHRRLDYALAAQRRFGEVVEMWSGFIARHPDEGRAYLERGGAWFQQDRRAEAARDASEACRLGVPDGCTQAERLLGRR